MGTSNGVWLDQETGKVVTSKPARGRQLVAPGKEMTPQLDALVARYKGEDAPAPASDDGPSLDDMTKDELLAEADRRGVEVAKSSTKAEIIEALS